MANIEHYFGHLRAADRTNHNLYKIHNLELFSEAVHAKGAPPQILLRLYRQYCTTNLPIIGGAAGVQACTTGPLILLSAAHFVNMSPPVYRYIEGIHTSLYFTDENMRSALKYKPEPEDVFIVSYPKCGTTWMQYLVYNIFTEGVPPKDMEEFLSRSIFLEMTGSLAVKKMCRPGCIKTHFSFDKHPYSTRAKYLYIARNPYDCCVSFYHHTKSFPAYFFETGTFNEFFHMFLEGKVDSGDYFVNLLSWHDHRRDPNVLFLTYEGLKKDTESWVLKMADFLGKEYGSKLRCDAHAVKTIIQMSSMETMKKIFSRDHATLDGTNLSTDDKSKNPSECFEESVLAAMKKPMTGDFIRKGIIGDWRNHFSEEQVAKMKRWTAIRTAGSDVMELWKDEDLP